MTTTYYDYPLFRELSDEQIDDFVQCCDEVTVSAGEVFIEQGVRGAKLYFLVEGQMKVFATEGEEDEEHELARLEAPAVVGEMEFLTGQPRAASVRALSFTRGLVMPFDRLMKQLENGDSASLRVFFNTAKVIACRLEAMDRKFAELERQGPGARFDELKDFQKKLMNEWTF